MIQIYFLPSETDSQIQGRQSFASGKWSQQVEQLVHTTGDLSGDATGDLDLLLTGDLDVDFSRTGDTDRAGESDWSLAGDLASPSIFIGSSSSPEPAALGDPSSVDINRS